VATTAVYFFTIVVVSWLNYFLWFVFCFFRRNKKNLSLSLTSALLVQKMCSWKCLSMSLKEYTML